MLIKELLEYIQLNEVGSTAAKSMQWADDRDVKVLSATGLAKEYVGKTINMFSLFCDTVGSPCYLSQSDRINLRRLKVGEIAEFTGISGDSVKIKRIR